MKRHLRNVVGIAGALAALTVVAAVVALDTFLKRDEAEQ